MIVKAKRGLFTARFYVYCSLDCAVDAEPDLENIGEFHTALQAVEVLRRATWLIEDDYFTEQRCAECGAEVLA